MDYLIELLNGVIDKLTEAKGFALGKKLKENIPKLVFTNNTIKFRDISPNTFKAKTRDLVEKKESDEKEMLGSVSYREKEKRYMGRFYFLGKRYYVYAQSETEAWNKIRAKRKELKEEKREDTSISKNMALNTWFDFWIDNVKQEEVRESTYNILKENYDRYVRDAFGKRKVSKIKYIDIQQFLNSLPSYSAKIRIMGIFNQIFSLLAEEKYIPKNPMTSIKAPIKNKESKVIEKKRKIITFEEEQTIFNSFKHKNTFYYALKFILYTGLRRGEALGLIWSNVDLDNNRIYIDRQYNETVKKITEPKTENAIRYVPLLPEAREILLELAKHPHNNTDFVFPDLQRLTQRTSVLSNKLGIYFTPHLLRHTFASRLYASGVDIKAIQQVLGHENVDTTLNVYVHLIQSVDSGLLKRIREYFISINIIRLLD